MHRTSSYAILYYYFAVYTLFKTIFDTKSIKIQDNNCTKRLKQTYLVQWVEEGDKA